MYVHIYILSIFSLTVSKRKSFSYFALFIQLLERILNNWFKSQTAEADDHKPYGPI